jgi:hypothetical protein
MRVCAVGWTMYMVLTEAEMQLAGHHLKEEVSGGYSYTVGGG